MVRILKALLVIALAAVLVVGVTANAGCDSCGTDDIPNGDNPNGDVANGDEPNGDEPDLTSAPGVTIDCDEFDGTSFQDGDPAPVFRFEDAGGQTFALSDFQGRAVVLTFWRTNCGYCNLQMPFIQQVYDEWPKEELAILIMNIGEQADKVTEHLDDMGISLPLLLDIDSKVAAQYRVSSIPITFFIDKEGLLRYAKIGAFQSAEELSNIVAQLVTL